MKAANFQYQASKPKAVTGNVKVHQPRPSEEFCFQPATFGHTHQLQFSRGAFLYPNSNFEFMGEQAEDVGIVSNIFAAF